MQYFKIVLVIESHSVVKLLKALEMVLIGLSKEPSTEDANASELAANGGRRRSGPINHTSSNEDDFIERVASVGW